MKVRPSGWRLTHSCLCGHGTSSVSRPGTTVPVWTTKCSSKRSVSRQPLDTLLAVWVTYNHPDHSPELGGVVGEFGFGGRQLFENCSFWRSSTFCVHDMAHNLDFSALEYLFSTSTFYKGEGLVGTQMFAHFLFELGFPPKSQASYFTGVVRCVRKKKTTYANLPCRMAVHSSEFRSQTCPNLINPHGRVSVST